MSTWTHYGIKALYVEFRKTTMVDILEIEGLTVAYITEKGPLIAVNDLSFSVEKGEVLGIAGESGSGKSTLANAILRLLRPPAKVLRGKVLYDSGRDLLSLPEEEFRKLRWREISYVPQGSMNSLNPVTRIRDQFADVIKYNRPELSRKEIHQLMLDSLNKVRLNGERVLDSYPHELSGGMKQRVVIAMAISLKPKVIVADEPTTALDVVTQKEIIKILRKLNEEMGVTILMVSHDISVLAEVCSSILVMYGGREMEKAPTQDILRSPKHPYTIGLISSIPRLRGDKVIYSIPGESPDLRNPSPGCIFHPRCSSKFSPCPIEEPPLIKLQGNREVRCHLFGGKGR
jgi:peptide/nickel transport system ATP-binding protein